ncbi:MAG TPA: aromatic ring-hydroxylating dioxygenase subunit alpha [Candidatus Binataceae bacterium]|jgi:phenylpropionate dioxygenase-like ring-hydroxylating dioxygenase large terminal subunit|nr:aromatic ring-hydroxylating dioxygenase subunit alpha [Candidatus Binataceae bacterium]
MKTDMSNHRWAKQNPDLDTAPIPIEPCCSEDYYQLERERIFKRSYLIVGRVEDVPKPGDFFVHDLPVAETSLLVVRGKDDKIRAFHNMCSHRGNRLVWEEQGSCRGYFTCKFHSWAYDTAGSLRIVTDEENFFDLRKDELGLTAITCKIWEGFIFVNLDPQPKQTLGEYLDGVTGHLKGYPFDRMQLAYGYTIEEKVNWKVLMDAQNESYHLPYLHEATFPDYFALNDKKSLRTLAFKRFGRHSVYSTEANPDRKATAAEKCAISMDTSIVEGEPTMIGVFDFHVIFPNSVIAFLGNWYFHYRLWPLAMDRTRWEIRVYFRPPQNAGQLLAREYMKNKLRDALLEDACTHEKIQSMLKSGAKKFFMMQDDEAQIRFFHKMVDEHVRAAER